MSSRHDKVQAWLQRRDQIRDLIAALGYWPLDRWALSVELGSRVDAQLWQWNREKRGKGRRPRLHLRLMEDWLESVHAKGWAVCAGLFVLHAVPLSWEGMGVDVCLAVETASVVGHRGHERWLRLNNWSGFLASYAGHWALSSTRLGAAQAAMAPFEAEFGIFRPPA